MWVKKMRIFTQLSMPVRIQSTARKHVRKRTYIRQNENVEKKNLVKSGRVIIRRSLVGGGQYIVRRRRWWRCPAMEVTGDGARVEVNFDFKRGATGGAGPSRDRSDRAVATNRLTLARAFPPAECAARRTYSRSAGGVACARAVVGPKNQYRLTCRRPFFP